MAKGSASTTVQPSCVVEPHTALKNPRPGLDPGPLATGGALRVEVAGQARDGCASPLRSACQPFVDGINYRLAGLAGKPRFQRVSIAVVGQQRDAL